MNILASPVLIIIFVVIMLAALGFVIYVAYTLLRDAGRKRQRQAVPPSRPTGKKPEPEQVNRFRAILNESGKNPELERKMLEEELAARAEEAKK